MHELSIAQSIVDLVAEQMLDQPGARVSAVHLRLGALSGVVSGALQTAFSQASIAAGMRGAKLVIEEVPVTIFCNACGEERPIASIQDFRCRACATPGNQVIHGREMEIAAIEVADA